MDTIHIETLSMANHYKTLNGEKAPSNSDRNISKFDHLDPFKFGHYKKGVGISMDLRHLLLTLSRLA